MVDEEALRKAGRAVRLIVCDLDGTLLNNRKAISQENLAALREAQAKGIRVSLCSGRVPAMLEAYTRRLGIQGPVITANGAVIFDTRTGEIPYGKYAEPEQVYPLLRFCIAEGLDTVVVSSHGCAYTPGSKRIARFEQYNEIALQDNLPGLSLRPLDPAAALEGSIYKVLISGLSGETQERVAKRILSLGSLSVTSSEAGLLDIGAWGISKGAGLRLLADILGIKQQEICVMGDYLNDIPMLQGAGLAIAMGNAADPVKAQAMAVTASNEEDGVAQGIGRFIL
jgi:Cof subfamily protein (haloacid dehalogenase superfamily)